jgi:Tfp pilus assembly protein PilO
METAPANRPIVYSFLIVVFVLVLGVTTLLTVSHNRSQHLQDQAIDLRRNLFQKNQKIKALENRLKNCDTLEAASATRYSCDSNLDFKDGWSRSN